jgi:hypothetical protein
MSNENEVAQLLSFNNGKNVFHVGLQRNVLGEEMCAIPHSGEGWRENPVPTSHENIGHTTPTPAPVPRTMHQDEGARPIGDARGSGIAHPRHCTPAVAALNAFRKPRLVIINPPLTKSLPSGCLSIGMVSLVRQFENSPCVAQLHALTGASVWYHTLGFT